MEYIFYACFIIGGWVLLYYIIKLAVKHAILEARSITAPQQRTTYLEPAPERSQGYTSDMSVFTIGQIALREKYERGEITLEQYQKDFASV